MARVRVQRYGKQGFADVDTEATKGATLGTNLYREDGTVVTEADLTPSSEPAARTKTLWSLLASIPANITALASLATDGWIRRDGAAITARALAATDSSYDNTTSGLSATDVQGAVDELAASGGGEFVPTAVADGQTFTVPENKQALFTLPIELLGAASLDVSGALVEVA